MCFVKLTAGPSLQRRLYSPSATAFRTSWDRLFGYFHVTRIQRGLQMPGTTNHLVRMREIDNLKELPPFRTRATEPAACRHHQHQPSTPCLRASSTIILAAQSTSSAVVCRPVDSRSVPAAKSSETCAPPTPRLTAPAVHRANNAEHSNTPQRFLSICKATYVTALYVSMQETPHPTPSRYMQWTKTHLTMGRADDAEAGAFWGFRHPHNLSPNRASRCTAPSTTLPDDPTPIPPLLNPHPSIPPPPNLHGYEHCRHGGSVH